MKSCPENIALPWVVLHTECTYRHAAWSGCKFIWIEVPMQTLMQIPQQNNEHDPIKVRLAIHFYGTARRA